MSRTTAVLAGWIGCVAIAAAAVQSSAKPAPATPPAQRPTVFRSGVDLVTLDVSVLDKNHLPVRGLTADDFVITENGKPQKVAALHEVDMDEPPPPAVAWMRDVTPDVTTNTIEDSRLVIIVIDDALIPMDPRITKDTKKIVTDVINKLGPTDFTAIVFTADGRHAQDFTHDRATLLAAADTFTGGVASYTFGYESADPSGQPQVDPDSHYYEGAVKTLASVADFLISASQRRKALIWISPGVPMDPAESGPKAITQVNGQTGGGFMANHDLQEHLLNETRDMLRRAQQANVVIYPIDPTGLGGLEDYIHHRLVAAMGGEKPDPRGTSHPQVVAHEKATLSFDFVETAAANTGGHAIVNTNDFGPGIDQILRENDSYYLLGFQPSNTKEDGSLRRVDVKVNRPGLEVRTRSGYYAPDSAENAKAAKATENTVLAKAIGGLLPATDLPLGVTVAPFAVPGQHTVAVTIAMGVRQPVPAEAARSKITESTELQISAFTPDGQPRGTERQTAHVQLRAGATGDAEYEVLGRIDLAPGRYSLRLAAHDVTSKKTGSVAANVIVPDFTNEAFSISGVVVSRTPAKPSAPKDVLRALFPVVPTAAREFALGDDASAFLRLYQSGSKPIGSVSLAIRIADGHGGTPVSETRALGVDTFATAAPSTEQSAPGPGSLFGGPPAGTRGRGVQTPDATKPDPFANTWLRTADVTYDIPLAKLTPGPYLLTFEATRGATSLTRNVRFSVK